MAYPDGPRDAEALLVDPLTRDLYILSKRDLFSRVYRAGYPPSTTTQTTLEFVCMLPLGLVTAGDVSPDGNQVIVRGMFQACLWRRDPARPLWQAFDGKVWDLPLASEPQGEAIGFDGHGQGYYTTSEGKDPLIHHYAPKTPGP
jgi:hypothetical protein